jgi:hypothetical protein
MTESLQDYSRAVLRLYTRLPHTPVKVRQGDCRLLEQLYRRGVPVSIIEAALFLASARRICRHPAKPPLPPIRSLAYFLPAIEELLRTPIPPGYLAYVRSKVTLKPTK